MTRFLLIADTHWGAGERGYKVQPKYDEKLPELLAALNSWMEENGTIDFILHGGDIIHDTDDAGIRAAVAYFKLPVRVHLCVGNHDLTTEGSIDRWLKLAPDFFVDGSPDYAIETSDCVIHVIPNQYGPKPFFWKHESTPHYLDAQLEMLERRIESRPDATHLILTHSPVHAITQDQSGLADLFHEPPGPFTKAVTRLAEKHAVTCVMGAHSHANMNKELNGVNYITVSSLVESPFEFKLFEVGAASLSMRTHNLWDRIPFLADYDWEKNFAQGRVCDRSFEKDL